LWATWRVGTLCAMSSLTLPAGLSDAFELSTASSDEIAEVYGLVVDETIAVLGHCHNTVEDVRAWLEPPDGAESRQVLVRRKTGELSQWWEGIRGPGSTRVLVLVHTHPDVSPADADALTQAAWQLMLPWVEEISGTDRTDEVLVHSGCLIGDDAAFQRLLDAGFRHERTFWEMIGPVADQPEANAVVEGLAIKPASDQALVHRLIQEGFAGHWGFEPTGFEDWLAGEKGAAGYDPALWLLAEMDAEPAAAMLLSRRAAADNGLYVQEIATLREYRRRGIASALLRSAFDVAREQGYDHVALHVDSDNADGAPGVYQRAGLQVRDGFHAFLRRLPPPAAPRGALAHGKAHTQHLI